MIPYMWVQIECFWFEKHYIHGDKWNTDTDDQKSGKMISSCFSVNYSQQAPVLYSGTEKDNMSDPMNWSLNIIKT